MFKRWRKFNNVMIWISMIAGFIITISLTVFAASSYYMRDYAWIICIGGLFIVGLSHCIWGLFVEMALNIERISTNSIKSDPNSPMVIERGDWKCSMCGKENPHVNLFCQGCGQPKNGMENKS